MLVLSRKVGQRVVIDGDIVVTVAQVKGNSVRLGVEAPPHCRIWREEFLSRKGREYARQADGNGRKLAG